MSMIFNQERSHLCYVHLKEVVDQLVVDQEVVDHHVFFSFIKTVD